MSDGSQNPGKEDLMSKEQEKRRQERYKKILKGTDQIFPKEDRKEESQLEAAIENVLGPVLNSFVLWVLKESREKGVQRLYFLARDGYLMYRCARIYCAKLDLPMECRYLSCSRYSVRIPLFHLDREEALEYICRGGIQVTLDKVLGRAGLSPTEKEKVLEELDLTGEREQVIPYAGLGEIKRKLKDCRYFMECMCAHSVKAYPLFAAYLEQEGLLEQKKAALVDSGWVGSMQKNLNLVLKKLGRREDLTGYYWGLYQLPPKAKRKDHFCYYFSPEKGLIEKVYFSNCLFEAIFSAPHGMTVGYEKKGEHIKPRYGRMDPERREFMLRLEKSMLEYARKTAEKLEDIDQVDLKAQKKAVKRLLRLFMGHPTAREAEWFGRLEFSDDVREDVRQPVAVKMTEKEIRGNHVWSKGRAMLGLKKQYVKESAWLEGSVVRSGKRETYHLWMYRLYKYLLYIRKRYHHEKEHHGKSKERENDKV